MQPEFIVAGLGNPGKEYTFTRHNAGFLTLDYISQRLDFDIKSLKFKSLCGQCRMGGKEVLFIKPQTFMNSSGEAVREALTFYKLPAERLIVIYDDISFEPGKLRIRSKGSAGGHNGMKSIIEQLSSDGFCRIKLGVGKKPPEYDLADWVLSKIPKQDQENMFSAIENAAKALELVLSGDVQKAMASYN